MCNYGLVNRIVWQLQALLGAGRVGGVRGSGEGRGGVIIQCLKYEKTVEVRKINQSR